MHRPVLPTKLFELRNHFRENGFDIKLVGGCVRDWLINPTANVKDIDLCTDASPQEQRGIYRTYNYRHIDTGLQHGTYTVVLNKESFEITSLRTETDHDGRHASVQYIRDWDLDLARRDLTINAMSMSFEGKLTDPFNGQQDLAQGIVRFVGNPDDRMQEDYLRILRWCRFHARIAKGKFVADDVLTTEAIMRNMHGLSKISRERVWSEISRILADENGLTEILEILRLGMGKYIDFPVPSQDQKSISFRRLEIAHSNTRDPVTLVAGYLGQRNLIDDLAADWHWSGNERAKAREISEFLFDTKKMDLEEIIKFAKYRVAVSNYVLPWVVEAVRIMGHPSVAADLLTWRVPFFPVSGDHLIAIGFQPGVLMGEKIKELKNLWAESNYYLTKEELIKHATKDLAFPFQSI